MLNGVLLNEFWCRVCLTLVYKILMDLFKEKNGRCKRLDGLFIYSGLDRIDNNLPHTEENVVPCCKQCNKAKSYRSQEEFFEWVENVYKNLIIPKE
jgi:5-methylcytosine-specific restriction endonuclease McrA